MEIAAKSKKLELTDGEKYVVKLQSRLIDCRGDFGKYLDDERVREYARYISKYYFSRGKNNDVYLEPVIDSFVGDLVLAPKLHSIKYLWRYNYDDLDLLSNFYSFAHEKNGYFHLAHGELPTPTKRNFKQGLRILGVDLGDYLDKIWDAFLLEGKRSNVARRVINAVAGLHFDKLTNERYGFDESESIKNRRKADGLGKFRYIRRGLKWMALGTRKAAETVDLRDESISDLWGYRIKRDKQKQAIKIAVSNNGRQQFQADVRGILEKKINPRTKLKEVSNYYYYFFARHRFANNTNWFEIDKWVLRRTQYTRKMIPKGEGHIFLAGKNYKGVSTFLPKRCNFFWNLLEELNCDYKLIWNPHRFLRNE